MLRPTFVPIGLALLAGTTIACSNDETTGPPEAVRITLSAPTLSIPCSGTGFLTASLTREGGFEGTVMVTVEGLPDGVAATLSPDHLSGTTTTTSISLAVDASAVSGSYQVTVIASASIGQVSSTFALILTEAPDFSLYAQPSALTITRGQTGTVAIQITRVGGLSDAVALSIVGPLPEGIAGTLASPGTQGSTVQLTLDVGLSAPVGQHPITVNGTSGSLPARTVTIFLTVRSAVLDWGLQVEPSALTTRAGTGVMARVQIFPSDDMTIPPDLSLVSPVPGITARFPMFYLDWSFDMVVEVAQSVAIGTYQLAVKGERADLPGVTHTAAFTLTVIP